MIGGSILQTSATLESLRLTWKMKKKGWRMIKKETVPPFFDFEVFFSLFFSVKLQKNAYLLREWPCKLLSLLCFCFSQMF